ncbi:aspartate/glutamate racemase family protein [Aspergillus mulundensis]|uniref:Aspartate racemase n=1 Tax=Aspergillus mulundensis TaxID=1810919 RepID=A0A3D8SVW6_9EURO|nr:hypothetical protein DSM5745_02076 [Aspergillus mulundensis]RDW90301.1 hypothetical protein DSM5745_02076 [Aspergillus mulundensis]
MKTIGLIGGLAWPSTITYYTTINRLVSQSLGPHHSARLILAQTDFHPLLHFIRSKDWPSLAKELLALCKQLENAGADFIVIACNTVHKVLPLIEDEISLPVVHIVDATVDKIQELGIPKVGLIGSPLTMTDGYFVERLVERGVEVVVPDDSDRRMIHRALGEEFALGIFLPETRERFLAVIGRLVERGAEGVVLGCTEFGRLFETGESEEGVLLIGTAEVHCEVAVKVALA